MKDNNLERLIKDTYIEFNNEMDMYSDIEIPEFDNVINKFNSNLKEKSTSSSLGKKIALVASFTVVILISTFLSSIPKVIAFKFNVIKTFEELRGDTIDIKFSTGDDSKNTIDNNSDISNTNDQIEKLVSFDEAREGVPFKLLVPEYLPEEYTVESIKLVKTMGDFFSVNQTYTNSSGKILQIYQSTISENRQETISMSSELRMENIKINNFNIRLATDDENFKTMLWIYNDVKFEMLVPYSITDSELKKIIESLK